MVHVFEKAFDFTRNHSKGICALILCLTCAFACTFFLTQPSVALADEPTGIEDPTGSTNESESSDQETDDDQGNAGDQGTNGDQNDSGDETGSGDESNANNNSPAAPPVTPEPPKEDPNKYLKDANGNVITGAGWHALGGKWYYTKADGERLKSWQTTGGSRYYLDPTTGAMLTGWQGIDGNKYYFGGANDGSMKTGWKKIGSTWHYFDPSTGALKTGWQTLGGRYYLDPANNGAMKTGWAQAVDNGVQNWYYFGGANDGAVKTGWKKLGAWYYLDPKKNGAMAYGLTQVGSAWYYLSDANSGAMKSGWQKIEGKWYYFGGANDGSMKTGWKKIGAWYYLDPKANGAMAYGRQTIDGKVYYLSDANSGAMKSGWQQIDGKWYYFGGANDGSLKTGWQKLGPWYYLDPADNGAMVANELREIDKKKYSFNSSGAMRTNERIRLENNECGFASPSGEIVKIGVFDGDKVILEPKGYVLTGWQQVAGAWFYADGSGVLQTGWKKDGGAWYYLSPSSGAMVTGSYKVNGAMEYFEAGGAWNEEKSNMVRRAQGFSSRTGNLVLVDVNKCRVGVFSGYQGNWSLIRYEACVCGAPGSPTIRGTYATGYHLNVLPKWPNALNCTNITGGYFFHSILNSRSELGNHLSHGCIRLDWPFARYMQTLPYGSTVNLY